ncbi:MAG: ATP-binding protein [Mangrovibacterium sp.]|nr:ATP-binding protein [Mangrovibacterium sp.]
MKIAIASGKGGTGKTFVATNLFWVAQESGMPVTLVDCDAEEPNVAEFVSGEEQSTREVFQQVPVIDPEKCTFCGKCFEYCNYHAILFLPQNHFIKVIPDLCHDCGACTYACNTGAITEEPKLLGKVKAFSFNEHALLIESRSEVGVYSPVAVIKKAIKEADHRSLTLMDSPPGISCPFIATIDQADFVILVTEPTPFGLHDLELSVATIQQLGKPFGVVINRAGLGNHEMYDWLEKNKILLLLEIPFDKEIARIYSDGKILAKENSAYQEIFSNLLKRITHYYLSWSN